MRKEIDRLLKRKTLKVICCRELPKAANILGGRYFPAIKYQGTEREIWKARFIVQGQKRSAKSSLVHNTSVASKQSIRMLIGIAVCLDFEFSLQM